MTTKNNAASTIANSLAKVTAPEAPKYQHYTSARVSMRLVTTAGKPIIFTGYEFLTQNKDLIEYLDKEIKDGLPGITRGELVSLEDKDPMAALKRKIIAEHEAKKEKDAIAAARGESKDMGKTAGASTLNPTSTNQVAN